MPRSNGIGLENPGKRASEIACTLICFGGMMVSLAKPIARELSHWMGVLVRGQSISMRVWQRRIISLAQTKRPACSDSVAEELTNLMIFAIGRTGPLMLGTGKFSDSMMCAPDRLWAFMTLR